MGKTGAMFKFIENIWEKQPVDLIQKNGAMFIENMGKTTGKSNFNMDNSTDKQNIMKLLTQNTNAAFNSANKPNQSRDCLLIYICKYKGRMPRKFHVKSVVFCRTSLYNILYFLN